MIVVTTCPVCRQKFEHQITDEEYQILISGEIPDYWPIEVREQFISGTCDDCWKAINWKE